MKGQFLNQVSFSLILICFGIACSMSDEAIVLLEKRYQENQAAVVGVTCTGQPNNYTLNVTIVSPDTGCDQYADWWEVITADGDLIYRRILGHSHVNEQPFTRSGGLVNVGPDDSIYVRAHMNNLGYGSSIFSGTLRNDLSPDTLDITFASELIFESPLPENCAF